MGASGVHHSVSSVVLVSTVLGAAGCSLAGCNRRPPQRPNVILVSLDCLNERQFGQTLSRGQAPNLAHLAQDALVFRRAYAHAPWTTPSHMSMLSGLYPLQHGRNIPYGLMIRFNDAYDRVPLFETLPERLAAAGYDTVGFVGAGSISAAFGLGQGFSTYRESPRDNPEQSDLPASLAGIRSFLDHRNDRPFFLFLHTYELHYPLATGRSPFRRAIGYVDEQLGTLLSLLRERGLYDSSLIVLTGDHGSHMLHTEGKCSAHGVGHYESNLRVPLVLKLPAGGPKGPREELVRHVDLLPTVLDVVGLPTGSYRGPGSSIPRRLAQGRTAEPAYSFSEADGRCQRRRAVVDEHFKYIYTPNRARDRILVQSALFFDDVCLGIPACASVPKEELYDLDADPFEERNLLQGTLDGRAAGALDRLQAQMTAHINLPPAYRLRLTTEGSRLDDSTQEALRALGYVQ